jgi:hypothetical protein
VSCHGGIVVSMLATGPKGCGFEPGQGDKNPQLEVPCHKILWHVKDLFKSHGDG